MSLDNELDAMERAHAESPTVKRLTRELDNLREHNAKLEALISDVAERYMMQRDGVFEGDLSTRVNFLTGRVR